MQDSTCLGDKGTLALSRVWARHPEWPTLSVYQEKRNVDAPTAENIHWVEGFQDDSEMRRIQNAHTIHLCPSEAEGCGYYIVEGRTEPQGLGMSYYVDEEALGKKIAQLLRLGPGERDSLGANAREWYAGNDLHFRERIRAVIEKVADSSVFPAPEY